MSEPLEYWSLNQNLCARVCLFVCLFYILVCTHTCLVMNHMGRSEDSIQELDFSFHHVSPKHQTLIMHGGKSLYPVSHIVSLSATLDDFLTMDSKTGSYWVKGCEPLKGLSHSADSLLTGCSSADLALAYAYLTSNIYHICLFLFNRKDLQWYFHFLKTTKNTSVQLYSSGCVLQAFTNCCFKRASLTHL